MKFDIGDHSPPNKSSCAFGWIIPALVFNTIKEKLFTYFGGEERIEMGLVVCININTTNSSNSNHPDFWMVKT